MQRLLQVVLITGGDSGIGRAVAVLMAKESAKAVAIVYLPKEQPVGGGGSKLSLRLGSEQQIWDLGLPSLVQLPCLLLLHSPP
jgi:NAD(P)-dependent dehydrogenase (short-subunit alcohol dehydrogenase family)